MRSPPNLLVQLLTPLRTRLPSYSSAISFPYTLTTFFVSSMLPKPRSTARSRLTATGTTAPSSRPPPTPKTSSSASDSSPLSSLPSSSESELSDIEDSGSDYATTSSYFTPSSLNRRKPAHKEVPSTPVSPTVKEEVKDEEVDIKPKRTRKPAVKVEPPKGEPESALGDLNEIKPILPPPPKRQSKKATKGIKTEPPENWERLYDIVKRYRLSHPTVVDTMGCERLHDTSTPPNVQRFHTLVSLLLSSQTKDVITAPTVRGLQTDLPGGLTVQSILDVPDEKLNQMISKVGFHRRKTSYLKQVATILRRDYADDIPNTAEGLMALPGIGPKMAHLCMPAAWGDAHTTGIGVDVHVHRITNLWGWVETKTPEETRVALEGWLPRDKWREVNWLLVGWGQSVCGSGKGIMGRKCNVCPLGVGEGRGMCRAAFKGEWGTKEEREAWRRGEKGGAGRKRGKMESSGEEEIEEEAEEEGCVEDHKPKMRQPRKRVMGGDVKRRRKGEEEVKEEGDVKPKLEEDEPPQGVKVEIKTEDGWQEAPEFAIPTPATVEDTEDVKA